MRKADLTRITSVAARLHDHLHELYAREPRNPTFEQVGFLDGRDTVVNFIEYNEAGLALEHLLYMVHESEIEVAIEDVRALHDIAGRYRIVPLYELGD